MDGSLFIINIYISIYVPPFCHSKIVPRLLPLDNTGTGNEKHSYVPTKEPGSLCKPAARSDSCFIMSEEGKLFIGGLSFRTEQENLAEAFGKYGPITDCVIIKDRETLRSRGFGFVTFENPEDAKDAEKGMNGTELEERTIRVNVAERGRERGGFRSGRGGGYGGDRSYGGGDRSYGGGDRSYRGGGGSSYRGGGSDRSYGGSDRSYGGSDRSYGGSDRSYGGSDRSYGGNDRSYGGGSDRSYGGGSDRSYGGGSDRSYGGGSDRSYGGGGGGSRSYGGGGGRQSDGNQYQSSGYSRQSYRDSNE